MRAVQECRTKDSQFITLLVRCFRFENARAFSLACSFCNGHILRFSKGERYIQPQLRAAGREDSRNLKVLSDDNYDNQESGRVFADLD